MSTAGAGRGFAASARPGSQTCSNVQDRGSKARLVGAWLQMRLGPETTPRSFPLAPVCMPRMNKSVPWASPGQGSTIAETGVPPCAPGRHGAGQTCWGERPRAWSIKSCDPRSSPLARRNIMCGSHPYRPPSLHARQTLEKRVDEPRGILNLWRVSKLIEGDELGPTDSVPGLTSEQGIVAERLGNVAGSSILADGRGIFKSNHKERRHADAVELINYRLGKNHIRGQRLIPGNDLAFIPAVHASHHADPAVVRRFPSSCIVSALLISLDRIESGPKLVLVELIDRSHGNPLGLPILQPNRIDEYQPAEILGIEERVSHRNHPTHGMPGDNWAYGSDMGKQSMSVGAKLV